ncbi:hypothetical protein V8F20_004354 [Naviculisporaceae sp. PSN 640]
MMRHFQMKVWFRQSMLTNAEPPPGTSIENASVKRLNQVFGRDYRTTDDPFGYEFDYECSEQSQSGTQQRQKPAERHQITARSRPDHGQQHRVDKMARGPRDLRGCHASPSTVLAMSQLQVTANTSDISNKSSDDQPIILETGPDCANKSSLSAKYNRWIVFYRHHEKEGRPQLPPTPSTRREQQSLSSDCAWTKLSSSSCTVGCFSTVELIKM